MRNYTKEECYRKISLRGASVEHNNRVVYIPENVHLGNKCLGMCDFIGYTVVTEAKRKTSRVSLNKFERKLWKEINKPKRKQPKMAMVQELICPG